MCWLIVSTGEGHVSRQCGTCGVRREGTANIKMTRPLVTMNIYLSMLDLTAHLVVSSASYTNLVRRRQGQAQNLI